MTMTTAAAQVEVEPPVLDEPALAEDSVAEQAGSRRTTSSRLHWSGSHG
jgi:hypothetical protein